MLMMEYVDGLSKESRQKYEAQLFDITRSDMQLIAVSDAYILMQIATLTDAELLERIQDHIYETEVA